VNATIVGLNALLDANVLNVKIAKIPMKRIKTSLKF
jgi:hypothetical protein